MKNSIRKNITRIIIPFTLLVVLFALTLTHLFRHSITEASRADDNSPSVNGSSTPDEATRERITDAFGKLPMRFEANRGQSDEKVKFFSRGNGYTLFLTSAEVVLSLSRQQGTGDDASATDGRGRKTKGGWARRDVLRMNLRGAHPTPLVQGADELSVKSNYFIGNDPKKWQTEVRQYAKVKYEGVYRGIDVVYYGNQQELEYDFIVAPGASPSQIRLAFNGAKKVLIDDQGDLILRTGGGDVRQRKPFIYQEVAGERRQIEGRYARIGKHEIGFEIGEYDVTKPLVIDPIITYSTYLGGANYDFGRGIAADNDGNAYVTGWTESINFPTRNERQTDQGFSDAFVTKFNTNLSGDASLVYSTYLGGGSGDIAYGIAADEVGNVYVTGRSDSTNFPTRNQYQTDQLSADTFVTKLNTNLSGDASLIYSTYVGGSSADIGQAVAADELGNVYITGFTQSTNFPLRNQYQTDRFSNDGFVTKLNTNLSGDASLVYSTYLGGNGLDEGSGIAADEMGNAYVTGTTESTDFPIRNELQTDQPNPDAFVTKFDTNLSGDAALVYSTYLGGSTTDEGMGIAADAAGNAYVTGYTAAANFPIRNQYQSTTLTGNVDAFVTRLDTNLMGDASLIYSTLLVGNSVDIGRGIATDGLGNVYVAGRTDSTNFPLRDHFQTNQPGQDAFVSRINTNLRGDVSLIYSTYFGGSQVEEAFGIDIDDDGNAYIAGETYSSDLPLLNHYQTYQIQSATLRDAFVVRMADPTPDADEDGVPDAVDNCPAVFNPAQEDLDGDGIGNPCDMDADNDGQTDSDETACGSNPLDAASLAPDQDADNSPDCVDPDDDNDGVVDTADNCQLTANPDQANYDGDSQGDVCDEDDDNDGQTDADEIACGSDSLNGASLAADNDSDDSPDCIDPDDDNDAISDTEDNCQFVANPDQANNDGDSQGDVCDPDDDNDGVADTADNCPLTSNSDQADNDNDGIGDDCDADDDNDGVPDSTDNCPTTSNPDQADFDLDGIGDACDSEPGPQYDFDGFFQPVENMPTLNLMAAGGSVPLKFSLGGNQGLSVFAPEYPASSATACDSSEPGVVIEETVTAGNSSLTYDTVTGQYTYVWKTDRVWRGTCRILVVRFNEGTQYLAKFRFK